MFRLRNRWLPFVVSQEKVVALIHEARFFPMKGMYFRYTVRPNADRPRGSWLRITLLLKPQPAVRSD